MTGSGKTKQAIFETAATMFAQESYHEVSMKQIAQAVGITPPSIYNHFTSKDAILTSIYGYLSDQHNYQKPDLDKLLQLCETMHPHDVMRRTIFVFPEETQHLIFCTMLVTIAMMRTDPRADDIIKKDLLQMTYLYDIPLLEKMQKLGRIEPIDAERFALLHSSYSFSAAVRFCTPHAIKTDEWMAGMELLFQLIRPTFT